MKAADAARRKRNALSEAGGAPPPPKQSMKVVFQDGKLVVNDADLVGVRSISIPLLFGLCRHFFFFI